MRAISLLRALGFFEIFEAKQSLIKSNEFVIVCFCPHHAALIPRQQLRKRTGDHLTKHFSVSESELASFLVNMRHQEFIAEKRAQEPQQKEEEGVKNTREVISDALAAMLADPYLFTEWIRVAKLTRRQLRRYETSISSVRGVYEWAVCGPNGHVVLYVGFTKDMKKRTADHLGRSLKAKVCWSLPTYEKFC